MSKDLKQIIKIQEAIIKAKESEFLQVQKLFMHYLDKSIEGWNWYSRYWSHYNSLIKTIREYDDDVTIGEIKRKLGIKSAEDNEKQLKFDFGGENE